MRRTMHRTDGEWIEQGAVTASAITIPETPPITWFNRPDDVLSEDTDPVAMRVTSEGRVYGYAALWGVCHNGIHNTCLMPPPSPSDYSYFERHQRTAMTPEGLVEACVGPITLGVGHAPHSLSASETVAHYDRADLTVADVAIYENLHGIMFAGSLRAYCTPERAAMLKGSVLSGDWRPINGRNDLMALLAVNVPGYAVPRPSARVREGEVVALTAAGNMGLPDLQPLLLPRPDAIPPEVRLRVLEARLEGGVDGMLALAGIDS